MVTAEISIQRQRKAALSRRLSGVGLKEARERRDRFLQVASRWHRPAEKRKALKSARVNRAANSFEVVTREWLGKYSAI
jgi:hypothetical protein